MIPLDRLKTKEIRRWDIKKLLDFWLESENIDLNPHDDNEKRLLKFVRKNRGLCFCVYDGTRLIASVLTGNDGRRATIYHLLVAKEYRSQGIGSGLVLKVLELLRAQGIYKVNVTAFREAEDANAFWQSRGWKLRSELSLYSFELIK